MPFFNSGNLTIQVDNAGPVLAIRPSVPNLIERGAAQRPLDETGLLSGRGASDLDKDLLRKSGNTLAGEENFGDLSDRE